jgi:hypothetical protein
LPPTTTFTNPQRAFAQQAFAILATHRYNVLKKAPAFERDPTTFEFLWLLDRNSHLGLFKPSVIRGAEISPEILQALRNETSKILSDDEVHARLFSTLANTPEPKTRRMNARDTALASSLTYSLDTLARQLECEKCAYNCELNCGVNCTNGCAEGCRLEREITAFISLLVHRHAMRHPYALADTRDVARPRAYIFKPTPKLFRSEKIDAAATMASNNLTRGVRVCALTERYAQTNQYTSTTTSTSVQRRNLPYLSKPFSKPKPRPHQHCATGMADWVFGRREAEEDGGLFKDDVVPQMLVPPPRAANAKFKPLRVIRRIANKMTCTSGRGLEDVTKPQIPVPLTYAGQPIAPYEVEAEAAPVNSTTPTPPGSYLISPILPEHNLHPAEVSAPDIQHIEPIEITTLDFGTIISVFQVSSDESLDSDHVSSHDSHSSVYYDAQETSPESSDSVSDSDPDSDSDDSDDNLCSQIRPRSIVLGLDVDENEWRRLSPADTFVIRPTRLARPRPSRSTRYPNQMRLNKVPVTFPAHSCTRLATPRHRHLHRALRHQEKQGEVLFPTYFYDYHPPWVILESANIYAF